MKPVSWMTAEEACAHLRITLGAFHKFLQRERKKPRPRVRVHWFGRKMRFRQVEIDALIEPEPIASDVPSLRVVR